MTTDSASPANLDEALTAYLDGELAADERSALEARLATDTAARERLELLRRGRPGSEAFDLVLAMAPAGRLEAMVAAAESATVSRRSSFGALRAVAAGLMLIAAAGIGFAIARATAPSEVAEAPNWRDAVAEYVALYTPETFALAPTDPAAYASRIAQVGASLGLDLTPDALALPGLDLRGAVLFHYDGKPLGRLAYLSGENGLVALCIIRNDRADAPPAFEERRGLNAVFWNAHGLGYLVIGDMPRGAIESLADTLSARVS